MLFSNMKYRIRNLRSNYIPLKRFRNDLNPEISKYSSKVNLFNVVALVISLLINALLVWFGVLASEKTIRPIVHTNNVSFANIVGDELLITFENSGQAVAELKYRFEMVKEQIGDTASVPNGTIWHETDLYPHASHRVPWPKYKSSNINIEKFKYILKISWKYESVYPEWVPWISTYEDIKYYRLDKIDEQLLWRHLQFPNFREYDHLFSDFE